MFDWIRQLFGRSSRTLRDDQISTNPTLYAPAVLDDDRSQGDSSGSDYGGGSDSGGSGFGGGSDAGGGGSGS
jgi:uncharacterized membrane protein YgcG